MTENISTEDGSEISASAKGQRRFIIIVVSLLVSAFVLFFVGMFGVTSNTVSFILFPIGFLLMICACVYPFIHNRIKGGFWY